MAKSELITIIIDGHENGQSKDEIATELMKNGATFSIIPKLIKESGIKFGRARGSKPWQMRVADKVFEGLDKTEILDWLAEEGCGNAKYYANHYVPLIEYVRDHS